MQDGLPILNEKCCGALICKVVSVTETPTHMVLQFTSSHGGAYIGAPGNILWIDNVSLIY